MAQARMGGFGGLPAARPGGFLAAQPGPVPTDADFEAAVDASMTLAQTQAVHTAVTAAAGLVDGTAVRRTVMISGMRQVGIINFDLLVDFELTVLSDSLPPYPATTQQAISQLQIGQLRPGMTLQAAVDPANPKAVWLDLSSIK
jgi:hypothetical protein